MVSRRPPHLKHDHSFPSCIPSQGKKSYFTLAHPRTWVLPFLASRTILQGQQDKAFIVLPSPVNDNKLLLIQRRHESFIHPPGSPSYNRVWIRQEMLTINRIPLSLLQLNVWIEKYSEKQPEKVWTNITPSPMNIKLVKWDVTPRESWHHPHSSFKRHSLDSLPWRKDRPQKR